MPYINNYQSGNTTMSLTRIGDVAVQKGPDGNVTGLFHHSTGSNDWLSLDGNRDITVKDGGSNPFCLLSDSQIDVFHMAQGLPQTFNTTWNRTGGYQEPIMQPQTDL